MNVKSDSLTPSGTVTFYGQPKMSIYLTKSYLVSYNRMLFPFFMVFSVYFFFTGSCPVIA